MGNNFGDLFVTNRKGPKLGYFAPLLAELAALYAKLAMSVISIPHLTSNFYISDIVDIVQHMIDTHHMIRGAFFA